jgi:hypothetical protein
MTGSKSIALHPISALRPGRFILDCSGPIHRDWLREALFERGHKVLVYRRSFQMGDINTLPIHEGLQMASGDLAVVLSRAKETVNLLVDDLGSLHYNDHPLELLKAYYDALTWDGEAWIRFPKTFFVFLESGRRIPLQDYIAGKFPALAKRLHPRELDPQLISGASSPEDWILLRKDRMIPKLFFHIVERTTGGTSHPAGKPHAPYLEFVERPRPKQPGGLFRRAA